MTRHVRPVDNSNQNSNRTAGAAISVDLTFALILVVSTGQVLLVPPALAQNKVTKTQITATAPSNASSSTSSLLAAYNLYKSGKFADSAAAYEAIIAKATPEPRLYYYAALAQRDSGHPVRAKQLFDYISTNFPQSAEAVSIKPPDAVSKTNDKEKAKGNIEAAAELSAAGIVATKPHVKGAPAFTIDEIAREGANAIDQSRYPNCWFEASMSALAHLPRGQRMLANMIHYGDGDKYVVRFPGDGKEYIVSEADATKAGIANRALWASLLECAQIKKFPNNDGASGTYADQSRLEVGMGCITGRRAEEIMVRNASVTELSSFIGGALRSQVPIIASTYDPRSMAGHPQLVVGPHAYTVIGLDQSKNMVILRNPHGKNSQRFSLASDPQHLKFEQMDDGVFKMNLEIFPDYFYEVARSFI